jgi:hypothetical protein
MIDEPVIGWLRVVPITWFGVFALAFVPRRAGLKPRSSRAYWWCLASFGASALFTGITAMAIYGATMRYLSDVTPGLVLVGLLGALALRSSRAGLLLPRATSALIAVLAAATIGFGMLIGYQGYGAHFNQHNPELDARLVKALSLCGAEPLEEPLYGP